MQNRPSVPQKILFIGNSFTAPADTDLNGQTPSLLALGPDSALAPMILAAIARSDRDRILCKEPGRRASLAANRSRNSSSRWGPGESPWISDRR